MHGTVTPPPISIKDTPALTGAPNKKRKIICFSGSYIDTTSFARLTQTKAKNLTRFISFSRL